MDGKILFCDCSVARVLPDEVKNQVLNELKERGENVLHVADLCEWVVKNPDRLKEYASQSRVIVACQPRAVKALFNLAGIELNPDLPVVNLRKLDAKQAIEQIRPQGTISVQWESSPPASEEWKAWFPVIDYSRCTECGQCFSFCLFGVYEKAEDGKIIVKNPKNCKTDCPACARVCPFSAIIFPKYTQGGPISGDEGEAKAEKPDLSKILGKDPFQMLKNRKRFAEDRDDEQARALRKKKLDEFEKP